MENVSRVIVEFLVDGQHPQRRHGAVPHRQEAQLTREHTPKQIPIIEEEGAGNTQIPH